MKLKKNCHHSAVSATTLPLQQTVQKSQSAKASAPQKVIAATRRYRSSGTSATMRIPHELRAQVAAIVAAYRKRHRDDPDCW